MSGPRGGGALRWVVRPADGACVADVLAKMGSEARGAAAEGRAFVGGRRARGDSPVREGDEIVVYAARAGGFSANTIPPRSAWARARCTRPRGSTSA